MRKFVASIALATAVVAGAPLLVSSPSEASTVIGAPGTPNQNWTGSLGLDFTVNTPIVVTALGAYSGPDQSGDITVAIFTSSGALVPGLEEIILTSSSPYTFDPVTPVTLALGTYQIVAWGYGTIGNYNTGMSPGTPITFNTLGGALTEGSPYYNNPGVTGFANGHLDNFNGGGDHYYGAGNFEAYATPLPSTWTMLIAGFVGFGFLTYRGTKKRAALAAA